MKNQSTYGYATNVAAAPKRYALARYYRGDESYWTGDFTPSGPQSSRKKDSAKIFPDAALAYGVAGGFHGLRYYRAVCLDPQENGDGFKSRWWMKQ